MSNNYLSPEMNYKLALLDIFVNIKTNVHNGQEGVRKRETFLEEFSKKFESIPSNTLEENIEFFSAMYDDIFSELNDYYSIQSETITENDYVNRTYHLTENDNIKEILKNIEKYAGSGRFMDGYLQNKNYELYRLISTAKHSLRDMSGIGANFDANGVGTVAPFYIPNDADIFTPICRRSYNIGGFFAMAEAHKRTLDNLMSKQEEFLRHVESYKEETREKMIREHIRFGTAYLKEVLSRIIIPVSCLEDEKLKQVCKEQGREVFVRKPEMKDFLFAGAHVHIYSSHDLEDDSSYVIKPILVEPVIPADTEDLKYHGVGLYSSYDDESERSCNGTVPHVIGGVLYCGADMDEFSKVIPEELLEEIRICEKLVESMDEEVQFEHSETGIMPIIQRLKQDDSTDVSHIVRKFLELEKLSNNPLTEDQEEALNKSEFSRIGYVYNGELNILNSQYPNGFCIFKDAENNYSAVKRDKYRNTWHKIILNRTYGDSGFIAACKALELPKGVYPIFDFAKRNETKEKALIGMAYYTISE